MKIRLVIQVLCLLGLWLGLGLQAHAQTDTVTYVYTDPQGTPLADADAQGNVIARYEYTPYGNTVTTLGSPPNGPGYTGHVNDPETGLVYMQARYYQPIGRFLSPDPAEPALGNLSSFNRYAYANNNPIGNIDPDGRSSNHTSPSRDCGEEPCVDSPPPPPPPCSASCMAQRYTSDHGGTRAEATVGVSIEAAGRAAALRELSRVHGGMWKGSNGKWYSSKWGGNGATGGRNAVEKSAERLKIAGRGLFLVGTGISVVQGGADLAHGDYAGAGKSGLDIGMSTVGELGGPAGWIASGIYFGVDATIGWGPVFQAQGEMYYQDAQNGEAWSPYGLVPSH